MGFEISALCEELQTGAKIILNEYGLLGGDVRLKAEKSGAFSVVGDEKEVTVFYTEKAEFYRGLAKAMANFGKKISVGESTSFVKFGYMPDLSRNGVLTVESLKKYIRLLALFGYNQIQLYTEETYEVEGEPYFGYLRGRYTQAELKEVNDYGLLFGVEVVPCVQVLGHLSRLFRWNRFSEVCEGYDVLFAGEEKTYELIDKMFASLRKSYTTDRIHIGMDETASLGRCAYWERHGEQKQRLDIFVNHLNRVNEIAKRYGFNKVMMWSDMFMKIEEDEETAIGKKPVREEIRKQVPENVTLVHWRYGLSPYDDDLLKSHKLFDRNLCFAGSVERHACASPYNTRASHILRNQIDQVKNYGIREFLVTAWGDGGSECSFFAGLPALFDAVEHAYGNELHENNAVFDFITHAKHQDMMDLELVNIWARHPDKLSRMYAQMYANCFNNYFYSQIKENDGEQYVEYAQKLKAARARSGEWKYLFDTQIALCDILALKMPLALKTRKAYEKGDKAAVKTLIKTCYKPLLKRYEAFRRAAEIQWMTECKPYGFEVITQRLGGIMAHTEHAIERLTAFVKGKTQKIDEYEIGILSMTENPEHDGEPVGEFSMERVYTLYKI